MLNKKIKKITNIINQTTNNLKEKIRKNYLNFRKNIINQKFDDFYC